MTSDSNTLAYALLCHDHTRIVYLLTDESLLQPFFQSVDGRSHDVGEPGRLDGPRRCLTVKASFDMNSWQSQSPSVQ